MVSATRWQQDALSQPTNPYQRLKWYPAFPGQGGYATFGWSPIPVGDGLRVRESPAGFMDGSGLSGAPGLPSTMNVMKVLGAIGGVFAGVWLAKKNMGR